MPTDHRVAPEPPRPFSPSARLGMAGAGALALLALVETAQALVSPWRAPTTSHWAAAALSLRAHFRAGDLIVAAPAWADPVMRMHVGDLLPIPLAARMDDARFARVWEISQGGARAPEAEGRTPAFQRKFGALTLRRLDRSAAVVTFDFLERLPEARVTVWNPRSRAAFVCGWQADRFVCPGTANAVQRSLVEVDNQIRTAILAPPVLSEIVAVEFPAATLGRELVVAAALHDTWARKSPGSVYFEVWIGGTPVKATTVHNRSDWLPLHIDTAAWAGKTTAVRFQISSPRPELRHLAFAAEARR